MTVSDFGKRSVPTLQLLTTDSASYLSALVHDRREGDDPNEALQLYIKAVLLPLFTAAAKEPDPSRRIRQTLEVVSQAREATMQLMELAIMGEAYMTERGKQIVKDLGQ